VQLLVISAAGLHAPADLDFFAKLDKVRCASTRRPTTKPPSAATGIPLAHPLESWTDTAPTTA
jgi:hypothetical protein